MRAVFGLVALLMTIAVPLVTPATPTPSGPEAPAPASATATTAGEDVYIVVTNGIAKDLTSQDYVQFLSSEQTMKDATVPTATVRAPCRPSRQEDQRDP